MVNNHLVHQILGIQWYTLSFISTTIVILDETAGCGISIKAKARQQFGVKLAFWWGTEMQSGERGTGQEDEQLKIFLSYPEPIHPSQHDFVNTIIRWLESQGLSPARLGSINFSLEPPLEAVRQLMPQCSGLLCIAFRRTKVAKATMIVRQENGTYVEREKNEVWLTSPWCHIEPAMGYQLGLPMMILRETHIIKEGVLDWGNVGKFIVTFDLDSDTGKAYLETDEWKALSQQWMKQVEKVHAGVSLWTKFRQMISNDASMVSDLKATFLVYLGLAVIIMASIKVVEKIFGWQ